MMPLTGSWSFADLLLYLAVGLLIVWLNRVLQFDPDPGGYVPKPSDKSLYSKCYVHCLTAYVVARLGLSLFLLPPLWVVVIMFILIPLYEWSQRFVNRWDIVAGYFGVILAVCVYIVQPVRSP